jgi:hypothetical protein
MCQQCHDNLKTSNEDTYRFLLSTLQDPKFHLWNSTSLSFILFAIEGQDGDNCHKIGNILVERFYKWYLGYSMGLWEYFYTYKNILGVSKFKGSKDIRRAIDNANLIYTSNKRH